MTLEEVLKFKEENNKPPRAKSVNDVLRLVEEYLVYMTKNGGKLSFNFSLEYSKEKGNYLRLSSSGKCPRAIAYSVIYQFEEQEEIKDLSPRAISIFQMGHALHELERALISEINELVSVEDTVYLEVDDYRIPGHIDGVLKLEDRDVIIDIKTVNEKTFNEFKKEPREDYVKQLNAYMYATGIKEAYLWVYNKNTSNRMIVPILYSEKVVEEVIDNFRKAIKGIKGELPERPYQYRIEDLGNGLVVKTLPWQCSYCPFTRICWPDFKLLTDGGKVRYIKVEEDESATQKDSELWF